MKKILIIEDDPAVSKGLSIAIEEAGYQPISKNDGNSGFEEAKKEAVDLIILDLILPNKDGLEICRDLRALKIDIPIIMLTSKKDEIDKIIGLEIGADDYIAKPFNIKELLARIKAVLRRTSKPEKDLKTYDFGDVQLNFTNLEAYKDGNPLKLSVHEFRLLEFFIKHKKEVVSRDKLLDEVWGFDSYPTTRTVDNYILSLRKKIEDDPAHPKHIITVHKAGYKFID
ncbi:response regulator transcription factor [Bacteroidota bacterium]